MISNFAEEVEQERRLPHAWLGDQRREPAPRSHTVQGRRQRFPMRPAKKQIARVRSHSEWLLCKFEKFQNHRFRLRLVFACLCPTSNTKPYRAPPGKAICSTHFSEFR